MSRRRSGPAKDHSVLHLERALLIDTVDRTRSVRLLVLGAQGSGTSTLMSLLRRHLGAAPVAVATDGAPDVVEMHLGDILDLNTTVMLVAPAHGPEWAATRRLLSKDSDGVLFVVDSTPGREDANRAAFDEMVEVLGPEGLQLWPLPGCMLYHKRDLAKRVDLTLLDDTLNREVWPGFETAATDGAPKLMEAIKALFKTILRASLQGP